MSRKKIILAVKAKGGRKAYADAVKLSKDNTASTQASTTLACKSKEDLMFINRNATSSRSHFAGYAKMQVPAGLRPTVGSGVGLWRIGNAS